MLFFLLDPFGKTRRSVARACGITPAHAWPTQARLRIVTSRDYAITGQMLEVLPNGSKWCFGGCDLVPCLPRDESWPFCRFLAHE